MTIGSGRAIRSIQVFVMFLGSASASSAVEVQTWTHRAAADFENGRLEGVVVTSTDRVELARQMSSLADLGVAHVWAMAREGDGNILAATGSPGYVVRVAPDGSVAKLYEAKDEQIFALAADQNGVVYFGTSPSGDIFRQVPDGKPEKIFSTEETYIWALGLDGNRSLFAATGTRGRLYRVPLDGGGAVHFQAKQKHLLSLAVGRDGVTYVGTSNEGLIYRVDAGGKGFVLYDAPQADVHALALDSAGTLYAGTGTPERPNLPPASSSGIFPSLKPLPLLMPAALGYLGPLAPVADAAAPAPAPVPSPQRGSLRSAAAAAGENSVYRIEPNGQVDEVFREKTLILSLATQADDLFVGTGQEGRLFLVRPKTGERQTLAQLESGQIQSMISRGDGSVIVGTGTPGKLWVVENRFAPKGTLVSDVFDAKLQTRWGKNAWRGDEPSGSKIAVEFRAGNIKVPDDTWSSWSTDSSTLPLARFLQYRATLESGQGKSTPSLGELTIYYATVNRPPTIESIEVPNLASSPITKADAKIEIRWKATDQNGDALSYNLEVKKDGWPDWVSVARDVTSNEFKWDPESMPSGVYRFRVTATDILANRQGEALASHRESDPFVLDRQAPSAAIQSMKRIGRRFEVVAVAKDEQTRLTAAAYSIDGVAWSPIFPDDGIFDSNKESITFQTEELHPGAYLLLVRFRDSAGHFGIADAILRVE